jgi:GntR family transcriptional regulator
MLLARDGATIELLGTEVVTELPGPLEAFGHPATSYLKLKRRHWRDRTPFLLADVYLERKLSKRIPKSAWTSKTALRLINDVPDLKIADARQILTVGSADPEVAADLDLALNAPVALVRRIAVDSGGNILMMANGIYRGDVVRLDMKLK